MSKKNILNGRQEQPSHTSEASQAHEARGEIDPSETGREQVAALAYDLWEARRDRP